MSEISNSSPQTASLDTPLDTPRARIADFKEMTKPGITLMVVLTTGLGFLLAGGETFSFPLLVYALLGTGLVSGGASVLNHVLERETDALMQRTANRPLPTGRVDPDVA